METPFKHQRKQAAGVKTRKHEEHRVYCLRC